MVRFSALRHGHGFVATVISVGMVKHAVMVPGMIASVLASLVAGWMGAEPVRFRVEAPAVTWMMMVRVMVLAVACGLVSAAFIEVTYLIKKCYERFLRNPYLRAAVGGAVVVFLTLLVGNQDYNGSGMDVIVRAIRSGAGQPWDLWFKDSFHGADAGGWLWGGEIVPTFYVGAVSLCIRAYFRESRPAFAGRCRFCGHVRRW